MKNIKKIRTFEEIFKSLLPVFQKEVRDFAEYLLSVNTTDYVSGIDR